MDIDAALANMRELVLKALGAIDEPVTAEELAEQFEAIDDWLHLGGAFPIAWLRLRKKSKRELMAHDAQATRDALRF